MSFYVAMKDSNGKDWNAANNSCSSYVFCGNIKGRLPNKDQLLTIYNNIYTLNNAISVQGGSRISPNRYWSSTYNSNTLSHYMVDISNGDVFSYDRGDGVSALARPIL